MFALKKKVVRTSYKKGSMVNVTTSKSFYTLL